MFKWPPNHPPPCKGWKEKLEDAITLGNPHQHYDPRYEKIPVRKNVTKVYNPNLLTPECCDPTTIPPGCLDCCPPTENCPPADADKNVIAPYTRQSCTDTVTGDPIPDTKCDAQAEGAPGNPCGPWPGTLNNNQTFAYGSCAHATVPPVPCSGKVGDNCYNPPSSTDFKNLSECRMLGFKSVYAGKNWHGVRPFGADGCGEWTLITQCGDCTGFPEGSSKSCLASPPVPGAANRKYLTSSISYSQTNIAAFSEVVIGLESTFEATNTVERYTGKITKVATGTQRNFHWDAGGSSTTDTEIDIGAPEDLNLLSRCSSPGVWNYDGGCPELAGGSGGVLTIEREDDRILRLKFRSDFSDTAYMVSYHCDGEDPVITWVTEGGLSSIPCAYTILGTSPTGINIDIVWTLSEPYTGQDVLADLSRALATWNLSDNVLYPPRIDTVTNGGPFVTYNERLETDPMFGGWLDNLAFPDGWEDTSLPRYPSRPEGELVGAPLPIGSDAYFDFYHKVWNLDDPDFGFGFPSGYGQWSTTAPFYVPHMTQWTDETHHASLPHGPFVFCNSIHGAGAKFFFPVQLPDLSQPSATDQSSVKLYTTAMACKWAEVILFEKPPNNYQRPCNGDIEELDLDTLDCLSEDPEADALPRWPNAPCDCDDDAILAQVINTEAGDGNTTIVHCDRTHGLADDDSVNICGVKGNEVVNGTFKVTIITDTIFEIPVLSTGTYESGGNVSRNADGEEKYWNDVWRKGKFVFKEWSYNFRDFWESYRLILQSYQITTNNTTLDADGCPNGEGCPQCPQCPVDPAPAPVRFTPFIASRPGCGFSENTMDTGQIVHSGDETSGGSKWLANMTTGRYCVEFVPCTPCIVYIQPREQNITITAPNSTKIDMPYFSNAAPLDFYYGTLWIGRVEQWMTAPLWKAPGRGWESRICAPPCELGEGVGDECCDSLQEDDGSCCHAHCPGGDGDKYLSDGDVICLYPQRDYVEADDQIPAGAPALPAGSRRIGCGDYVKECNTAPSTTNKQDAAPGCPECMSPYFFWIEWIPDDDHPDCQGFYALRAGSDAAGTLLVGLPVQAAPFTPWKWFLNQEGCVVRDGSFSETYIRNGIVNDITESES